MKFGEVRSPQLSTSQLLKVDVIFFMKGRTLSYFTNSRTYRVFNKRTETVMESINVIIDDDEVKASNEGEENQPISAELPSPSVDIIKTSPGMSPAESLPISTASDTTTGASEDEDNPTNPPKQSLVNLNHPPQQLIGSIKERGRLRNKVIQLPNEVANQVSYSCYLAQTEPKKINEALQDESWVSTMHDELHQFTRNDVWTLVPLPANHNIISTKWIFKNKSDEHGTVVKNKARLVAQEYTQIEGIDFYKTFAPVAKLESIRILLSIACHLGFKLYQMGCKECLFERHSTRRSLCRTVERISKSSSTSSCLQAKESPVWA